MVGLHRFATKNCRRRPEPEWIQDLIKPAHDEIKQLHDAWPHDSEVEFHSLVYIKRPE